jgi:hypothetical protein
MAEFLREPLLIVQKGLSPDTFRQESAGEAGGLGR